MGFPQLQEGKCSMHGMFAYAPCLQNALPSAPCWISVLTIYLLWYWCMANPGQSVNKMLGWDIQIWFIFIMFLIVPKANNQTVWGPAVTHYHFQVLHQRCSRWSPKTLGLRYHLAPEKRPFQQKNDTRTEYFTIEIRTKPWIIYSLMM